ncbi:MAG: hypothetical protein D8M59_03025 [Planctomycetes bacterium]|nr:hypothetical protein [Planctomycetota bacterium]NOG52965.1 hypothetical protein [Planctomycetota bacterium]
MAVADHSVTDRFRCGLEYFGLGHRIAPFPVRRQARAWTLADLPPRDGLRIAPPDYIGVGTQKSGTSWWTGLIEQHPDVATNRFNRKEMHYLTHFLDRPLTDQDVEAYHAAFARPEGKQCGEWTPNYLAHPYALENLDRLSPAARILVMVRNPVDRFESGFNHEFKMRFGAMLAPSVRREVIKRYALRAESFWNGMYAAQLDILFALVEKARVLVLQYEACCEEPEKWIAQTYRFLGLTDSFVPAGIDRKVNRQRRIVGGLDDQARGLLATAYRADARRLSEQCPETIDLGLWPQLNE